MERLDCDRMFVAVIETGSFSKAAERLGVSPGQASKLVSRLESLLGAQLLKRTTRALQATEVGRGYYERIKPLLMELDDLDAAIKNESGVASGRLRVSVPVSFGTVQLAPALVEFAQHFPNIELDVNFSDRNVNLVDEGFDLAVRVGAPTDSSLIVRKLCDMRVVIAAAPEYLQAHGEPLEPASLANRECIIDSNFKEPLLWRFRDKDGSQTVAVTVSGRLRFSNAEACLAAAEAGLGIARLPSFMAGPRLAAGGLKSLLCPFEDGPYGVHVLYPSGRHLALKVRVLVDFLAARYRGQPSWDKGWQ
jgi:DNA-binding transcriptional LysR family regulator